MSERHDENHGENGYGEESGTSRRRFTGEGSYAADEREQTRDRERVTRQPLDEAGEIPAADGDVEGSERGRAERYED